MDKQKIFEEMAKTVQDQSAIDNAARELMRLYSSYMNAGFTKQEAFILLQISYSKTLDKSLGLRE